MKNARYLGFTILILSIVIYTLLSVIYNKYSRLLDEPVAYMYSTVADTVSKTSIAGLNEFTYRMPILVTLVLGYFNIPVGLWTFAMGILSILAVFIVTHRLTGDAVKSGLASLLLSVTPCFIYWFKLNNYGAYTLLPLWLIFLAIHMFSEKGLKTPLIIALAAVNSILWLSWSIGWFTLIAYSIYVAVSFIFRTLNRMDKLIGLTLLLTSLPLNILAYFKFITMYHIASFTTLALMLLITHLFSKIGEAGFTARLLSVLIPFIAGLSISIIVSNYTVLPGFPESYVKTHYAIYDYGLLGLLTIPALIYFLRNKIIRMNVNGVRLTVMITLFLVSIVISYYIPVFALIAIVSILPVISWSLLDSLIYIVNVLKMNRIIKTVVVSTIIVLVVLSSSLHSAIVVNVPPTPVRLDLPEIYHKEIIANESALLKAMDILKNNIMGGRAVIISYWGYSYLIKGYLGDLVEPYAYPWEYGKLRIVAQIFLSSDEKAYGLIKRAVGEGNVSEVYIVLAELVSFTGSYNESKNVDLGMVIEAPRASYHVYGDLDRVFLYIREAGFDRDQYIDPVFPYPNDPALSWRDAMLNSLMVKMIVNGLERMNYTVFNQADADLMDKPLKVTLNRDLYEHVGSVIVPIRRSKYVSYYGYTLVKETCYYVTIYRVKLS
ncbi:MAG: hypothetical protein QXZ39_04350 [Desulfurococcaceae archaeon]